MDNWTCWMSRWLNIMNILALKQSSWLPIFKMMSLLCALLQTLLKEWLTRASFWVEIMVVPFSTLETTRTLALVILLCAVLRVSAPQFMHAIICQKTNYFQTISVSCVADYNWFPIILLGITFSFFWKNHEAASRFAVASGGKVISNGFSVYTNQYGGYVEFYTRGNNHRWKVNIRVPGTVNESAFVLHSAQCSFS